MESTAISEDRQLIDAQMAEAREKVAALEVRRREADAEMERLLAEGQQYAVLKEVCVSLDKLHTMGAAHLFWGELDAINDPVENLARIRQGIYGFEEEVDTLEQRRQGIVREIRQEQDNIDFLAEELLRLQEQEERAKYEFVVERDFEDLPYRPMVMPWTSQGEDEWRFRKVLLTTLFMAFSLAWLMSLWTITPPAQDEVVQIPERLARLVKKEPPKPPEQPQERPLQEKEKKLASKEAPTPAETQQARKKAESSGLLAFKNSFSELMETSSEALLGADARIDDSGKKASGQAQRSLLVAQAKEGSRGINTAGLSRNVGGAGNGMGGVQFSRVESSIGTGYASDRPLSDGPGPSRTDEEIQIVFDRYKAALYRIYNRELRNDPTLRGKMVLRITIEPGGQVSACKVESTDLASKALVQEIVARVSRFNFGPKDGVPRITILYPIDFLPAT
jgi:outer membrane biosynthesis protein TonB